jgi:predicted dehydrogenase
MTRKKIGIGIIGMGWMGHVHARSYRMVPDRFIEEGIDPLLVVCADADESRARASQERFGFGKYVTDWREVIADPAVDVVDITAPNGMHLEIVKAATDAGKHVACEKPVGRFPEETIAAADAVRAAGVMSFVGYNYRWPPVVQYARDLIAAGKIGTITHYHGRFLNGYAGNPYGLLSWRFEEEHGLGTLGDLMTHVIDMAHLITGGIGKLVADRETFIRERPLPDPNATSHYAVGTADSPTGPVTNEDYVSSIVRFAGGAHGFLEACRVVNGAKCDMSFEVYGTKGAIKWNMERMNELEVQYRDDGNPAEDGYKTLLSGPAHPFHGSFNPAWGLNLGYEDTKIIEAKEFLCSVRDGVQREPSLESARKVALVQQAIMRSWDSGAWESVDGEGR